MRDNAFIGLKPFNSDYYDLFFGREDEKKRLLYNIINEPVSVVYSCPGCGRTSLLNSLDADKSFSDKCLSIRYDIPASGDDLLNDFLKNVLPRCGQPSYVDKTFSDDKSLWFVCKKLQANNLNKRIVFIFDNFENIFLYNLSQQNQFIQAVAAIVHGDNPEKFNDVLQNAMNGSNEDLSGEGISMMLKPIDVAFLFSVEKRRFSSLIYFCDSLSGLTKNTLEIEPFGLTKAANIIVKTSVAAQQSQTGFLFDSDAASFVAQKISEDGQTVLPFKIQAVCLKAEKYAKENNISVIDIATVEKSQCIDFVLQALDSFDNKTQLALLKSCIKEENPLPVSVLKAISKYNILPKTTETAINLRIVSRIITENFTECIVSSCNEVSDYILQKSSGTNKSIIKKKFSGINKQHDFFKRKSNKIILIFCVGIAVLSTAFALFAVSLKDKAEDNERKSKSNMLSAFAFQKLEDDPTFGLRLAQDAVALDKDNVQAYSALLNAFYNTDIFYNISAQLPFNTVSADISDDGKYISVCTKNVSLNIFNLLILTADGDTVSIIPHPAEITSAVFSHSNSKIITTAYDSTARIFSLSGNLLYQDKSHKSILWTSAISPDETMYMTAGGDFKVNINKMDGELVSVLSGHDYDVYSAKFSNDNKFVVTSGGDNTARLWTVDGRQLQVFNIDEDNRFSMSIIISADFSPDGKYILTASNDYLNKNHKAILWDLKGRQVAVFPGHTDWLNTAHFSPDGQQVITASRDKTVRVFKVSGEFEKVLKGHGSNVWSAKFMPDNNSVVSVGNDKTVRTWTIGKRFENYPAADGLNFACFSPDGLGLLIGTDSTLSLRDLTGEIVAEFKGHKKLINSASFSPDGSKIITASNDNTSAIYSSKGELLKVLSSHNNAVYCAIFSPDGKYCATAGEDSVVIITDLQTNKEVLARGHSGCVTCLAFSPDGKYLMSGGCDKKVIRWTPDGKIVDTFTGHFGTVNSVAYNFDGSLTVSTSADETAIIRDKNGCVVLTLRGYENKVNSAVFSPDGKYILTTSDDGMASFRTVDGRDIINFKHDGKVLQGVFSPDGKYMLTVYKTKHGNRSVKLRLLNPDDINKHIDKLDLYGKVWIPDEETMRKYR